MTDEEWRERIIEVKRHMEQLPRIRVSFGSPDLESGMEVCPPSIIRFKVLALLDELLK